MFIRRQIVKVFYGYVWIAFTAIFFLFTSTFNKIRDSDLKLDDSAHVGKLLWGGLLILELTGLYAVILLKRKYAHWDIFIFSAMASIFFLVFIAPASFFLILTILLSMGIR